MPNESMTIEIVGDATTMQEGQGTSTPPNIVLGPDNQYYDIPSDATPEQLTNFFKSYPVKQEMRAVPEKTALALDAADFLMGKYSGDNKVLKGISRVAGDLFSSSTGEVLKDRALGNDPGLFKSGLATMEFMPIVGGVVANTAKKFKTKADFINATSEEYVKNLWHDVYEKLWKEGKPSWDITDDLVIDYINKTPGVLSDIDIVAKSNIDFFNRFAEEEYVKSAGLKQGDKIYRGVEEGTWEMGWKAPRETGAHSSTLEDVAYDFAHRKRHTDRGGEYRTMEWQGKGKGLVLKAATVEGADLGHFSVENLIEHFKYNRQQYKELPDEFFTALDEIRRDYGGAGTIVSQANIPPGVDTYSYKSKLYDAIDKLFATDVKKLIEEYGFDHIVYRNNAETAGHISIIPFWESQVKEIENLYILPGNLEKEMNKLYKRLELAEENGRPDLIPSIRQEISRAIEYELAEGFSKRDARIAQKEIEDALSLEASVNDIKVKEINQPILMLQEVLGNPKELAAFMDAASNEVLKGISNFAKAHMQLFHSKKTKQMYGIVNELATNKLKERGL